MYDTIGMHLEHDDSEKCISILVNQKENYDCNSEVISYRGELKNLKVKINDKHISIVGSIPKYINGNNYEALSKKDIQLAIEKLSDILKLPIIESNIYRLDIGANIQVNEPVQTYYSNLGYLSRFSRDQFGNNQTLTYKNSQKNLIFYDKLKELQRKKVSIPESLEKHHLLRYEAKFFHRIPNAFETNEVKASDLYEESFFIKAIDLWKHFYFKIPRIRSIKLTNEAYEIKNLSDYMNSLAIVGIKHIGENEIYKLLQGLKPIMETYKIRRIKEKTNKILQSSKLTEINGTIIELDKKIIEVANNYR